MTDDLRELDALVAKKVMGIRPDLVSIRKGCVVLQRPEDGEFGKIYSPSSDWGAAGEVLGRMIELGWGVEIAGWERWQVIMISSGSPETRYEPLILAESGPEAICRAALAAVEASE